MPHYVLDARTATPHFPGIGRYVTNLARALIPQLAPDEHLTVFFNPAHPLELTSSAAVQGLLVNVSPFSLRQQWVIPRLLRQRKADLYHSAYYLMPYIAVAPTLLTLYDLIPILFPEHSTRRARLLFRWATGLALHAARRCLAISNATRRDVLAHFRIDPAQITTVPLAADPAFAPQPPESVAALRARLNLPQRFILYLGSNKPHKNLTRCIEAFSRMAKHTAHLVVAGAWLPKYPEARQRATALRLDDRITWLGPVAGPDQPALYTAATLFVFPSLYEGFGLPPLEAMACGTPVICSDTSSLPEVAGDAALLVDPMDAGALAATLDRVWSDAGLQQTMRVKGLEQAQRFSWSTNARETLVIYRKIVENSP